MSGTFRYACLVALGITSACAVDEASPEHMAPAMSGGAAGGGGSSSLGASGSVGEGGHGDFGGDAASTVADAGAPAPVDEAGVSPIDAAASPDAPASGCVTMGTELCDDFEGAQVDPRKWKINKPSAAATIAVDGLHVHGGKYALHVKIPAGQQSTAQITEAVTFPAKNDAFYTRIWAYFSPDLPADNNGGFHLGFIIAGGANDLGRVELALGSAGDKQFLGYSIYRGPPFVEFGPRSPLKVTPEKWICMELFESGEGGQSATRQVWIDGTELPEQKNVYNGQKPPQFDVVQIGMWQYHPTPILSDMWIDDVRVSSQRIGCNN